MTRFVKSAIAVALLTGISAPAFGQATNSVNTTSTTTIIRPVTISQNNALVFGRIVRPTSGTSTVTISSTSDTPSQSGANVIFLGTGQSRAKYTVAGEGGQVVTVDLGTGTFNLQRSGAPDIPVTLSRDPAGNLTLGGSLGDVANGTAPLNIGGSFAISDSTPTGDYTGTFTVTVAYQ
ncbi:MAG TPA: DUF4402 domain-containing protein [Allosphingosinicella sp.]|uniref:DUF4402 domain-containing protein n=1 Tax=Allosphingosinicella sp. TaxID=2823234 RepID=UPI002EDAAF63